MKIRIFKIALLSLTLSLSFRGLFAQNSELNQLIQVANSQNRDLQIAYKNTEMYKAQINTAYDMPKTPVELQVGNIQNPFVRDYTLGVSQSFELPSVYKNKKQYLISLGQTAEVQTEVLKRQLKLEIRMLYSALTSVNSKTELINQELEKLKDLSRVYQQKFEQGEADQSDFLNIRLKENELARSLSVYEMEKKNLEMQLMQVLNQTSLPVLTYTAPWTYDGLKNTMLPGNPVKKLNNSLIDNALKEELTIKDHKKPTLNAGVYNQSMLGSLRQFVGVLGVEIPIFVKAYNARQQSAKLRVEMAEQQRDKFDFQMQTELNALQNQLEIIEKQLNSIRNSSLPDAEKSLSILLNKYKEGQTEYTDWYIVFGQYLGYKNNLIDLEKEKNITVSKIYYLSENE